MARINLLVLSLSALIGLSTAQSLADLPQCGRDCISDMIAEASQFICGPTNALCLCNSVSFGNGIWDCALHSCTNGSDVRSILGYVAGYCSAAASSAVAPNTILPATVAFANIASPMTDSSPSRETGIYSTTFTSSTGSASTSVTTSQIKGPTFTPKPSPPLSTGAKAGLGVGVCLIITTLLILIAVIFRERWKQKRAAKSVKLLESGCYEKPELHHTDLPRTTGRAELPGSLLLSEVTNGQTLARGELPVELANSITTSPRSKSDWKGATHGQGAVLLSLEHQE